jgi:hypothetical protein
LNRIPDRPDFTLLVVVNGSDGNKLDAKPMLGCQKQAFSLKGEAVVRSQQQGYQVAVSEPESALTVG